MAGCGPLRTNLQRRGGKGLKDNIIFEKSNVIPRMTISGCLYASMASVCNTWFNIGMWLQTLID